MTEIATRPVGHLTVSADQTTWTEDQALVLKQAGVDNDVTHAELTGFLHLTQRTGLDPFSRQIYLIGRHDSRAGRKVFSPQTGIDGYRIVAQRTAERTGTPLSYDDTLWCGEDGIWRDVWLPREAPRAAKITVYRGASKFSAVATYDEYAQTKKGGEPTNMWARMPAVMLAKCAESLALRKAFPHDLAGVYTAEEMGQADNPARDTDTAPKQAQRQYAQAADDQWATAPAAMAQKVAEGEYAEEVKTDPEPPEATQQQLETIAGGLKAVRGVTEYDAILTAVSQILEREIGRPDELTAEEAEQVLTTLRDEQKAKAKQQRQQSETAMAPDVKPKYASGAQLTALNTALGKQGITERAERLAWCAPKIGHQLASTKDLTAAEVSALIDQLRRTEQASVPPEMTAYDALMLSVKDVADGEVDPQGVDADITAELAAGQITDEQAATLRQGLNAVVDKQLTGAAS